MGAGSYTFEELPAYMPESWEAKAKELGALIRAREIRSAEDLLRLVFLYLTEGRSFAGTSALIGFCGDFHLNKIAVYKRILNSEGWLKWLCENILRGGGLLIEKPAWLCGKDVCLIYGSEEVTLGQEKAYYMSRYCLDLFTLSMKEFHLTDIKTGEKVGNFKSLGEKDIVIGE